MHQLIVSRIPNKVGVERLMPLKSPAHFLSSSVYELQHLRVRIPRVIDPTWRLVQCLNSFINTLENRVLRLDIYLWTTSWFLLLSSLSLFLRMHTPFYNLVCFVVHIIYINMIGSSTCMSTILPAHAWNRFDCWQVKNRLVYHRLFLICHFLQDRIWAFDFLVRCWTY